MNKKSKFSKQTIIQGIYRATFYKHTSIQSEKNRINFLTLLDLNYSNILNKRCFREAFTYGLSKAVRVQRGYIFDFITSSQIFKYLDLKNKTLFFVTALSLKHRHYEDTLKLLINENLSLLKKKAIQNALTRRIIRSVERKDFETLRLLNKYDIAVRLTITSLHEIRSTLQLPSHLTHDLLLEKLAPTEAADLWQYKLGSP